MKSFKKWSELKEGPMVASPPSNLEQLVYSLDFDQVKKSVSSLHPQDVEDALESIVFNLYCNQHNIDRFSGSSKKRVEEIIDYLVQSCPNPKHVLDYYTNHFECPE